MKYSVHSHLESAQTQAQLVPLVFYLSFQDLLPAQLYNTVFFKATLIQFYNDSYIPALNQNQIFRFIS